MEVPLNTSAITQLLTLLYAGKRTIRVVKVLKEDEMNQRINVPELIDQIDELTKEEFLRVLKSGENFNVTMLDEAVCGSCVGGYRVIKTSSLQRDRVRCRVCSAKGKVLKEVDFSITLLMGFVTYRC